jgi:hypothetical protein
MQAAEAAQSLGIADLRLPIGNQQLEVDKCIDLKDEGPVLISDLKFQILRCQRRGL